jgi:hypothetical protein
MASSVKSQLDTSKRNKFALREVDGWSYHAANLSKNSKSVRPLNLDRPIGLAKRLEIMNDLISFTNIPPIVIHNLVERNLTPRQPYQSSPLSFLNAVGDSWSLWPSSNSLEWSYVDIEHLRYLEFWFFNPVAENLAIISFNLTTGVGLNATGTFEVSSSTTANKTEYSVTGYRNGTYDVVIQPSDSSGVLVKVDIGAEVDYFAFHSVTYTTVPT